MTYSKWQRQDHVREVQEYLRVIALTDNVYREIAIDGIYGEETAEAVRLFQLTNALPATGNVDFQTWELLAEHYWDALTLLTPPQTARHFPTPQYVIHPGDRGNLITILQAILNTLTETWDGYPPLEINGEYDSDTEQRVRELQAIGDFPETGTVDRYFWDHLILWYNSL